MGLLIEEAPKSEYFQKKQCPMARDVVVLKWAIMGLILCASYKGILLSKLINIEYEKSIDSIDDVLRSQKPVAVLAASGILNLLKSDPRRKVKEIGNRLKPYYTVEAAKRRDNAALIRPMWVVNGYKKFHTC